MQRTQGASVRPAPRASAAVAAEATSMSVRWARSLFQESETSFSCCCCALVFSEAMSLSRLCVRSCHHDFNASPERGGGVSKNLEWNGQWGPDRFPHPAVHRVPWRKHQTTDHLETASTISSKGLRCGKCPHHKEFESCFLRRHQQQFQDQTSKKIVPQKVPTIGRTS